MPHIHRVAAYVCVSVCSGVLAYRSLYASVVCMRNTGTGKAAQANRSGQLSESLL